MGIRYTTELDFPASTVWDWFSRPGAVRRLIPPWQPMRVISEAASLRDGTAELRIAGVPWTAQHQPDGYRAGERFVDELTSFPLRLATPWRHEHLFEAVGGGTRITDTVHSRVPEAVLRSTFRYREAQLAGDLAAHAATDGRTGGRRLTVAVSGAGGLIGSQLCALLTTGGHRVVRLVRGPAAARANADDAGAADEAGLAPVTERQWDPQAPADGLLAGVDAVVHLAGEPIAGRFTDQHKAAIRDSRIGPTRRLAEAAAGAGVGTFVSASAIGYYGADRGDELVDETAAPGTDFLAGVVADWEADSAAVAGALRVVQVRTGLVLTPNGGFLRPIRPLFAAGLGGPLGSGQQWLSWIGIDDLLEVYLRAITDPQVSGPVNAVAPNPVRYTEFAKTLGRVLRRPAILPTPSFGPKLLLGSEGAAELAEASQRVEPRVLADTGHRFRHLELEPALRHLFGRPQS